MEIAQKPIWETLPTSKEQLDQEVCSFNDERLEKCSALSDDIKEKYLHGSAEERQKLIDGDNETIRKIIAEGYEKGTPLPSFVQFDGQFLQINTGGNPTDIQNQELLEFYEFVVHERSLPKTPDAYQKEKENELMNEVLAMPFFQEMVTVIDQNCTLEDAIVLKNAIQEFFNVFISYENIFTEEEENQIKEDLKRLSFENIGEAIKNPNAFPGLQKMYKKQEQQVNQAFQKAETIFESIAQRNPTLKPAFEPIIENAEKFELRPGNLFYDHVAAASYNTANANAILNGAPDYYSMQDNTPYPLNGTSGDESLYNYTLKEKAVGLPTSASVPVIDEAMKPVAAQATTNITPPSLKIQPEQANEISPIQAETTINDGYEQIREKIEDLKEQKEAMLKKEIQIGENIIAIIKKDYPTVNASQAEKGSIKKENLSKGELESLEIKNQLQKVRLSEMVQKSEKALQDAGFFTDISVNTPTNVTISWKSQKILDFENQIKELEKQLPKTEYSEAIEPVMRGGKLTSKPFVDHYADDDYSIPNNFDFAGTRAKEEVDDRNTEGFL